MAVSEGRQGATDSVTEEIRKLIHSDWTLVDTSAYGYQPNPEEARLDEYLQDWAEYHSAPSGEMREPSHSAVIVGGGYSKTLEQMYEKDVMVPRCKAIETIVWEDLQPARRAAILHRYRFAVHRFPRGNYAELLQEARQDIIRGLRVRHLWIA